MATEGPGVTGGTTETTDEFKADPERGGCMKLGWGCLPVLVAGFGLMPLMMF